MENIAQHVSPDGLLRLNLQRDTHGVTIGFNDFAWSTSGGFLASKWRISEDAAVTRFVDEVLSNRAIIAVALADSAIRDVWVTDRPAAELKYKRHEETIVFRFWNGSRWGIGDGGVADIKPREL
jgi:hypothetical protein